MDEFLHKAKTEGLLKEFKIEGKKKPIFFFDAVSMMFQQEKFYRNILKEKILWNTNKPKFGFHFVDDNRQKICSISTYIKRIMNDDLLSDDFKQNHLRIIEIEPSIFKLYESLWQGSSNMSEGKTQWFNSQSCIAKMNMMKDMGNSIYKCGGLNEAALTIYIGGAQQFGFYEAGYHTQCSNDHDHDIILSKLYNNMSLMCYKLKYYRLAKNYCIKGLQLNPKYKKCHQRFEQIHYIIMNRIIQEFIS